MVWKRGVLSVLVLVLFLFMIPSYGNASSTFVYTGTLEGETHPWDDYRFVLAAGTQMTIDEVCDPTTPLDPGMQVLNSAGTVLASDDDSGTVICAQSRSSRLVFTAPATDVYTIRASSYEILFNGNDTTDPNADGNYTLTVVLNCDGGPAGFFTGTLEGETHPWDDYPLPLTAGSAVMIDEICDPTTPLDPGMQVLNSSGTVLASDDDSGTVHCAQSRSSRIIFTAPATDTYTIRASSYEILFNGNDTTDPNADGNYTLTIVSGCGGAILDADLSLTKTVNNIYPEVGQNVIFTVTVSNSGPSTANGVTVLDQLPATLTYVSDDASGAYNTATGIWNAGTINSGASKSLHITANVADSTLKVNTAQVAAAAAFDPDSTPNNNNPAEDDQASVTVTPRSADLSAVMTDTPDPVIAGQDITYTISYSNTGPDAAMSATVTDTTPAGTTFVSAQVLSGDGWIIGSPAPGGTGVIFFSRGNSPAGDTATLQVVLKVNASVTDGATITNNAAATATTSDPVPSNNVSEATTTVFAQADLAVTKIGTPNPVAAGNNITYTLTLAGNGPSDAREVSVTDSTPQGTTFVSASVTSGSGWSINAPAVGGTGNIVFSKATVTVGETATFMVVLKVDAGVPSGSVITNSVVANSTTTDPTPADNTGTAATNVQTIADLAVTNSGSPHPVQAGNNITYTVTFVNNGPSNAQDVTVADTVPVNTTFVSAAIAVGTGWNVTAPPVGGVGNVVFSKGTAASGETAAFTIVVQVKPGTANGAVISNTAAAAASTSDSNSGNNSATATTTVTTVADLQVAMTGSPNPVNAGENITYTINFINGGPSDAQTVSVTDTVPTGATFVSAAVTAGTGWSITSPAVGGTGNIVFSKPAVTASETATFKIVVKVDPGTASGSSVSNTVTAETDTTDPVSGNDSATSHINVQTSADLAVTLTGTPDPAVAGSNITYTVQFDNNGPSGAQDLDISDITPSGTTFVSAQVTNGAGWSLSSPAVGGTGTISFTKATVAAGETATFEVVVQVDSATADGTVISNTATAAGSTPDPNSGNNSDTETTTAQWQADLAITNLDTPEPVQPGQSITYTIGFTNNGPNTAANVSIADITPTDTTFVSATVTSGDGWSTTTPAVGSTGTISFTKTSVPDGESATFEIVVQVNSGAVSGSHITNHSDVTSGTLDPDTANNTATAEAAVVRIGQSLAVDPMGRFVIFAKDPGCGKKVLFYQAINSGGNLMGLPMQLVACTVLEGDVAGIDVAEDGGNYWISFGGKLATDGKYLMRIDVAGNIQVAPTLVISAEKFGSTPGATAMVLKGCCKIHMYVIGNNGIVYRSVINATSLKAKRPRDTGILAASSDLLQIAQGDNKFLALEKREHVMKGFSLDKKGLTDETSWRLVLATEGSHELGSVSADGTAALSNHSDSTMESLYFQNLDADGLPIGSPTVVAGANDITAVDVSSYLPGGTRFIIYAADTGIFLQVIDSAGGKLGSPIPLL